MIEKVEAAKSLHELPNDRKLTTGDGDEYRVQVGDYRIGIEMRVPVPARTPARCSSATIELID